MNWLEILGVLFLVLVVVVGLLIVFLPIGDR